ncbi:MAG: TetR/AcrR family transcriptional regulator [Mogibacterium sp.]|nr:TetR/AcrR family transcriptional regulator [Mogibacterium sp.]
MQNTDNDNLRIRILDAAAELFDSTGIRFTVDDLARSLGMSKKTIYTVFRDKRSIMTETIDRFFDDATAEEARILSDTTLSVPEQLREVIGNVPPRYAGNKLTQLFVLKEKYPAVYRHWQHRREEYWNGIAALLERGIAQGVIRPVSIPVFKTMFQATIEQFFQQDVLVRNNISYRDALMEVADVLVNGIVL